MVANSKPHLWPRGGCNCYKGRGRRLARVTPLKPPLCFSLVRYPRPLSLAFSSLYSALTLLRGNLLINSQLVSAARRLINTRRVARWRHAQNLPSIVGEIVRVTLKDFQAV